MSHELAILLIEDDPIMGESLMERFELEGFTARWARNAAEARGWLARGGFSVVLSDLRLPDMSGEALFRAAQAEYPNLPRWLFITAYGTVDQAVTLLKQGAADYLTKPFDLGALVEKLKLYAMAETATMPTAQPSLGVSPAMRRIEAQLPLLAAKARTLLITGESGVGKEMLARAYHRLTPRGERAPLVAVNCSAIPEGLIEAELFGYERGAFTGALKTRKGVFEQADGGTLFLDEIGDMPLTMQAKLLRVIQERRVTRLGSERVIPIDVHIVSATHQDLKKRVAQGLFREDLYYRLNIIQLHIPPLRQRREDILWLAHRFLAEVAPGRSFSPEAEQALLAHDWPGNVRELKHAIECGAILAKDATLEVADLFGMETLADMTEDVPTRLADFLAQSERRHIARTLQACGGHLGRTVAALGISRKNLWEKMKKPGLSVQGDPA